VVIALNSGLGAYQEYNAEMSAASLQKMLKIKARVRRNNKEIEISSEELVPGDLVLLESGYKVPADLRLLVVNNLAADESFLTGESLATNKITGIIAKELGVSERKNMAYAGSTITTGRGLGIVTATGYGTEVGQIAEQVIESESAKPPLVVRMEKFTKQISVVIILISIYLAVILRFQGMDMASIFFFVVALAVSAIPEGLPVALTVALSIAVSRMSKRNVIVRKLPTVESLGSCTVIASDKTGTLTVNQQTARLIKLPGGEMFNVTGQGYNGEGQIEPEMNDNDQFYQLCKLSVLANEASLNKNDDKWEYYGDAIDVAFLAMSYKAGFEPNGFHNELELLGLIPYESEKKYAAAFYKEGQQTVIAAKGAVETILSMCNRMHVKGQDIALDETCILKQVEVIAAQGYRVLAVAGADCDLDEKKVVYESKDLPQMILYGLVGFIDPLRPEALASVNQCKNAGIKVIMITGDHPLTAQAISKDLGIAYAGEDVVTGQQLADSGSSDSPAYIKLVNATHVFARVSPIQKLEIVEVLINQGEFVAVTGDGVNDAPALRRANIGVAMGSGTDVAKEISAMIVTDDNFSSIVSGVEEGRFAYDNVRKVIYLLISTGAAEVFLFLAAIFVGLPLPLLAVQLLWLNLVTNGIQDVALAFEGGEPGAMKRKPRKPTEKIFNPQMISQTLISGLTIGALCFGFWYVLIEVQNVSEYHARNVILLFMVILQNVHVFNCRSEYESAFKVPLSRNYILLFGVMAAQGIHILSMHIPFMQTILRAEPVTLLEWFEILILAIPLIAIMEIYKFINNKYFGK
jgi:calcium-translocating P-type ATPase